MGVEWFRVGEQGDVERVADMLQRLGVQRLRTGVSWAAWQRPEREWYGCLPPRPAASLDVCPYVHHTPRSRGVVPNAQSPPRRPRDFADVLDELLSAPGDSFSRVALRNKPSNLDDWDWLLALASDRFCEVAGAAGYWAQRCVVDAREVPEYRLYRYAAEELDERGSACGGFGIDTPHSHVGLAGENGNPKAAARTLAAGGSDNARAPFAATEPRQRRGKRPVTVITGGAGFIGTNVAEALLLRGERVRILDNLSRAGSEENLRRLREHHGDRIEYLPVDVRDRPSLRAGVEGAASVFHFAAQVAVTSSLDDPRLDFDVNLNGTVTLLEELRRLPVAPALVFTSTNKVYGSLADVSLERCDERWLPADAKLRCRGVDESRPLEFSTPYGCSKGGADQYVLDYAKTFGLPATVFRMSCIYGRHQHGNEDQGWVAHFLVSLLAGRSLTIYGDGAQVRDVLHADDLVAALLLARDHIGDVVGSAFNVGGGAQNAISLLGLLAQMEELHGSLPEVTFAPARAGDQRWYVSDTRRLRRALAWEPAIGAADGIASLYAWLARNRRLVPASL
jgi:CDP-paratose 2-epimerase